MLGIIYLFLLLGTNCILKASDAIENEQNKINYRHLDGLTYTDNKGRSRLLTNNHIAVYSKYNKNCIGDYTLQDCVTGQIIKNFSQEESNKKHIEFIKKFNGDGKTTYSIDEENYKKHNDIFFWGQRFIDKETKDVYVIREFEYRYYFMDIHTGYLIRETDYSANIQFKIKDMTYLDLNEINKMQKEKIKSYNFRWNEDMDKNYS